MKLFDRENTAGHARNERYRRIRARAGEIWRQEGCPGDQHERHWLLAMREIDIEDDALPWRPSPKPAIPPPAIRTPGQAKAGALPQKQPSRLRSSRL